MTAKVHLYFGANKNKPTAVRVWDISQDIEDMETKALDQIEKEIHTKLGQFKENWQKEHQIPKAYISIKLPYTDTFYLSIRDTARMARYITKETKRFKTEILKLNQEDTGIPSETLEMVL